MTRTVNSGAIAPEIAASVVRLVDGSTRVDRRLRRSILLSVVILGAWLAF